MENFHIKQDNGRAYIKKTMTKYHLVMWEITHLHVGFDQTLKHLPLPALHPQYPMIPPVRTDPVWGRAQSGPVPPEGRTGPSPRLVVSDWTGLVWTSPNRIIFINFKVDPKN
jgi:hypothetical protein